MELRRFYALQTKSVDQLCFWIEDHAKGLKAWYVSTIGLSSSIDSQRQREGPHILNHDFLSSPRCEGTA